MKTADCILWTEGKMQTVVTWYMLKISVVCSLHFTLSLMSKVCGPQSAFTITIQRMDILKKGGRGEGMGGGEVMQQSGKFPIVAIGN